MLCRDNVHTGKAGFTVVIGNPNNDQRRVIIKLIRGLSPLKSHFHSATLLLTKPLPEVK